MFGVGNCGVKEDIEWDECGDGRDENVECDVVRG